MQFDHFHIRLIEPSDADAYFQLIDQNRSRLEDFFAGTVAQTLTPEATQTFVAAICEKAAGRLYFPFILAEETTGKIAGFIDVKNIDWNIPKAELGCFMDTDHAGQGIAGKALQMVIDHLFQTYGFKKLFLRTHPTNTAARSLAEKCGFEKEGLIRMDYKTTKGVLVDLIYYGLIR